MIKIEDVEKVIDEKIKDTIDLCGDEMIDIDTYKYHLEKIKESLKELEKKNNG